MCSSESFFPMNLVKDLQTHKHSCAPDFRREGAKPANSVLVPLSVFPVTLSVRASICLYNRDTTFVACSGSIFPEPEPRGDSVVPA
ncbi:hypothetical protein LIER_32795 [Lithospermum erythrorhizon]|uniref:Uncharacterized protein n=1 Tax=Lithospermum erythrorhizon TaxID=34254 RepID=A0AAV3RYW7_LITER